MKRSFAAAIVMGALITALALPMSALAFQVTGGGGTQTQNPYGYWYAGKEACAQEGCHAKIAAKPSPHSEMVKDVRAYPSELEPAASSGLWPYTSPFGGITIQPRDLYLQVGDSEGLHQYVGFQGSALATKVVPADDLPLWSPASFLVEEGHWKDSTGKLANGVYGQSCSACHNVGQTRPSDATYALPSGAMQTTSTPTTVSELGVQCESCHGSGKNPNGHKNGVPGVVGGYQVLKAQVCGQCHVTGTTPQNNVAGKPFGNPNGFTVDTTLSAYLTPVTTVGSEDAFMNYLTSGGTKPAFLPNGANYSLRHSYYNEWLINKAPGSGGEFGHADPVNGTVKKSVAAGSTKCLRCHSGLGFLNRIDAKAPTGTRIVPTFPTLATVTESDPGISCQVCHSGHIGYAEQGGYDTMRRWGNGTEVSCGDCHNWQFEVLDQQVQYETISGSEYSRPALNAASRHPQREMVTGGAGGEDGRGGMWGVVPMGSAMPDTTCNDCHMPRTAREGMPANDDGSADETRVSHRFHVVEPGDAVRWKLRPNGDSCAASCHKEDAAEYSREDFQAWIDQQHGAVANASADATQALNAAAADLGLSGWAKFIAAQPSVGAASTLPPARWAMLQHAAQNVDFVVNDASGGIHNPAYALAGLAKARLWAASANATLDATLGSGPAMGEGMTVSGSLLGLGGSPISGAEVVLETSVDGSTWTFVGSAKPNGSGAFALQTGRIVGSRTYRVRFSPSAGVDYVSPLMSVAVPVTTASVLPATATESWLDVPSAQVTMTATPGSLTFYTLSGATVLPQTIYTGTINITGEGRTNVNFWSTDGSGVEATQTFSVLIDRAAPAVNTDLASVYANKAVVHAWGTDNGAGVDSMRYAFGSASEGVDGSALTFVTYKLGKNNLVLSATDEAGKTTTRTVSVWVKAAPKLTMSPAGTKTISVGSSVKFSTTATRGKGADGTDLMFTGRPLVLQRWDGRRWNTWTKFSSGSGKVSWTRKFTSKGTSYWRWAAPADTYSYAGYSPILKVVTR